MIFSKAGVTANWNASFESLLDLAEASGLSPDYSCRSGICQTCACPLEGGEVDYVLEPLELPDPGVRVDLLFQTQDRSSGIGDLRMPSSHGGRTNG